ncbi:hypothetical protein GQ55_4G292100 [Panicum hallii var. hallii]|uniref:Uncharacterized protein n=1 Tax=Panicum hallii var. hallii TaxID=1504633 RepID=A0A2T7E1E2_9POAL|nr:hypothetical protein GQ55_4G292100 [Panicum hallii var. hallii]
MGNWGDSEMGYGVERGGARFIGGGGGLEIWGEILNWNGVGAGLRGKEAGAGREERIRVGGRRAVRRKIGENFDFAGGFENFGGILRAASGAAAPGGGCEGRRRSALRVGRFGLAVRGWRVGDASVKWELGPV